MKKQIITLAVVALLLSSCGIYTKYERPEVKTDGLYGQDIEVEDTTSIASLSWRELFTDPQLQSLIEHALQGNTDLQSAQWRIKEAEATLSSARLAYLPSFMLTPQGGVSSFDKSKGSWTYSGIASASWEIDIFGKLTNAKRRAKALYLQSLEYEQAVTTSLIANVANMYYTLLMLDAQYNVSAETAAKWRESVKTMRAMKAAGMTDEAGVAQTEANCYMVKPLCSTLNSKSVKWRIHFLFYWVMCPTPSNVESYRDKVSRKNLPLVFRCSCSLVVPT